MRNLLDNSLAEEPDNLSGQNTMSKSNLFDELIDQYRLDKHLGQSGVTDHYLAYDVDENHEAVVEILLPYLAQNKTYANRFGEKLKKVAQIKHRNIAQVLQVGITPSNNRPYFARTHFEAYPLKERISQLRKQETPVHSVYALKIVRQIAGALALTERLDIFHHDLQPGKILLKPDGQILISDLGVPRLKNIVANGHKIDQDPSYWSPEQAQGKPISARSHVYSLGIILFELLAGERPVTSNSLWGSVKNPPGKSPLEKYRGDLSIETYRLINRALRNRPWARFANSGELIPVIDEAIKAEEFLLGAGEKERRRSSRGLWLKFAIPLMALVVVTGLVLLLLRIFNGGDNIDNIAAIATINTTTPESVAVIAPVPTITPTDTAVPIIPAITVFEPAHGQIFNENDDINFSWTWPEPLADDAQFLVQVISSSENFVVGRVSEPISDLTYQTSASGSSLRNGFGIYQWQVVLISPSSGSSIAQSDLREFELVPAATNTAVPTPSITPTQLASATAAATATPLPQIQVSVSSVSLREGPGTNYNIITFLYQGDIVSVISINRADGNWYNVELENGDRGWVSIDVANPANETPLTAIPTAATIPPSPTPTNTPIPTATFVPTAVPTNDGGGGPSATQPPNPTKTPPPPP
ncbi:MAG: protein kinase [Chloroflexi bacterium]|nr:protein kinase [Chloroflexota bacterium]